MRGIMAAPLVLTILMSLSCAGNRPEPAPDAPKDPLPIRVVDFPGQTLLVLACTGPFAGMDDKITEFIDFIGERGIETTGDLGGAFFDNPAETPPGETRYEIRIPVAPGTVVAPPYRVMVTEPMTTAAVLLIGDYESIATRYPDIYRWIEENGYVPAGPLMEVYLEHAGSGATAAEYQTEVHVPVIKGSAPLSE